MKTRSIRHLIPACALAALLAAGCDPDDGGRGMAGMPHMRAGTEMDTAGLRALPVPAEHREGAALFASTCAQCHGEAALGTDQGPPLVHVVYEPGHHADAAFQLAVVRGVRAHHWGFGDMPPVPGVTQEQVDEIVGYVRWLQRNAGVY